MFSAFPRNNNRPDGVKNGQTNVKQMEITTDDVNDGDLAPKTAKGKTSQKSLKSSTMKPTEPDASTVLALSEIGLGFVKDGKTWRSIERLEGEKMSNSTKLLGVISKITRDGVCVSLPEFIGGFATWNELSDLLHTTTTEDELPDDISNYISIGQFLPCCVLDRPEDNGPVAVSFRASVVNASLATKTLTVGSVVACHVSSKEDHGYVMSVGASLDSRVSAFLRTDDDDYIIGQPLLCQVSSISGKHIALSCDIGISLAGTHKYLESILPGVLIDAIIVEYCHNGLLVNINGLLHGVISDHCLPDILTRDDWLSRYEIGSKVPCRVIVVDGDLSMLRLSGRESTVNLDVSSLVSLEGTVCNAGVVRVDGNSCVWLKSDKLDDDDDDKKEEEEEEETKDAIFAPAEDDNASDKGSIYFKLTSKLALHKDSTDGLSDLYHISDSVTVKVISACLPEGCLLCSSKKSIVSGSSPYRFSDVVIGQVMNAKVDKIVDDGNGAAITIGNGINATLPKIHYADACTVTSTNKRFDRIAFKGADLTVIVWEKYVLNGEKVVVVSHKKSLVEMAADCMIKEYSDAIAGKKTIGVVKSIIEAGIIVAFFGSTKGFIPTRILLRQGFDDIEESFVVGQLIKCVVLSSVVNNDRHEVTCAVDITGLETLDSLRSLTEAPVQDDGIVSGQVIEVMSDYVLVELTDKRICQLDRSHTSDFSFSSETAFDKLSIVGQVIDKAIVIGSYRGRTLISVKPALVKTFEMHPDSIPFTLSSQHVGQVCNGTVHKVEAYGVVVKFRGRASGLIPLALLKDTFTESAIGLFVVGDTISCSVKSIDESGRSLLSLKSARMKPHGSLFAESFCNEYSMLALHMFPDWALERGSACYCRVTKVLPKKHKVLVAVSQRPSSQMDSIAGEIFAKDVEELSQYSVDQSLNGAIIDVDVFSRKVIISTKKSIIDHANMTSLTSSNKFTVEYVSRYHAALSDSCGGIHMLVPGDFYCHLREIESLKVGELVSLPISRTRLLSLSASVLVCGEIAPKKRKEQGVSDDKASKRKFENFSMNDLESGSIISGKVTDIDLQNVTLSIPQLNSSYSEDEVKKKRRYSLDEEDMLCEDDDQAVRSVSAIIPLSLSYEWWSCNAFKTSRFVATAPACLSSICTGHNADSSKNHLPTSHPFSCIQLGQQLDARIVSMKAESHVVQAEMAIKIRLTNMIKESAGDDCLPIRTSDFAVGSVYAGVIINCGIGGYVVSLSCYARGFLHKSRCAPTWEACQSFCQSACVGDVIAVMVVELRSEKGMLNLSRKSGLEILRNEALNKINQSLFKSPKKLKEAEEFVRNDAEEHDLFQLLSDCPLPAKSQVDVTDGDIESLVNCSYLGSRSKSSKHDILCGRQFNDLEIGDLVIGSIDYTLNPLAPPCVMVSVGNHNYVRVDITEIDDVASWKPFPRLSESSEQHAASINNENGRLVLVRIIESAKEGGHVEGSLRPSRTDPDGDKAKCSQPDELPKEDDVVVGYVKGCVKAGCFIGLSCRTKGRVMFKNLSDAYVPNPLERFPIGKLVKGRIISPGTDGNSFEISLKASDVQKKTTEELLKSLQAGMIVSGIVKKIIKCGVLVILDDVDITALSHISQALDDPNGDLSSAYKEGDSVRAKVLNVAENKVAIGLKASCFKQPRPVTQTRTVLNESVPLKEVDHGDSDDDAEIEVEKEEIVEKELPTNNLSSSGSSSKSNVQPASILSWSDFLVSDKHDEDTAMEESDDVGEAADGTDNSGNQRRARHRVVDARKEEDEIRQKEKNLMHGNVTPTSPDDFERELLSCPNNSYLWIRFMAYFMELADIESARRIANRATNAIIYREEQERKNVWFAWMNMEHQFGDKASLQEVIRNASQYVEPLLVYLRLVEMYEEARDFESCEAVITGILLKRFKTSIDVWQAYQHFLIRRGRFDAAKDILSRSLQSLPKHNHVEITLKFAMQEFEFGSPARARVVMEGLITTFPRRTDLWLQFVDKEEKLGHIEEARTLYDRMSNMRWNEKNMKNVLKKNLKFEVKHGDEVSVDAVKQKAMSYVQKIQSRLREANSEHN